jgi:predicted enzyme related to lactoylglutathione lyase
MACELLINIDVDDLNRATAFYCSAFDLSVGRRFGNLGVELRGATCPLYLLVKQAGTRPTPASGVKRGYGRHWTPVHLDLVVDDVEAAVARALSAGAMLEGEVVRHVWGSIAQMADPFGHGFCLLQFHGRGYDEIADAAVPAAVDGTAGV